MSCTTSQFAAMGAALTCFTDKEIDYRDIKQRSSAKQSLLDRLRTSWSSGHIDDEEEDPVNWDVFLLQSNKSTASSGSRMLSDFYSRLLEESENCAFYFDSSGKRMKGKVLDRLELLNDYFLPLGPPCHLESLEMYSSSDDCFSTASTMMSEDDCWVSANRLFAVERHYLPSRSLLGRCSSMGNSSLKIDHGFTWPHLLEDVSSPNSNF
ncbi:hypothetical protein PsorP6_000330 [Peronosclerospora sorghi]|uniref:Uncharacterized protein n=1 Tax=Peronosclerospora sorghi TaxID=230839 RepID=A0ACC0WW69_9STRA|nr:hypothetical protein PsorP6_000330 [Peronosclerospora sorghi]